MKYIWGEKDISPGITVRASDGQLWKIIAVGVKNGGMYNFGMYKDSGNFCSCPTTKSELIGILNDGSFTPNFNIS